MARIKRESFSVTTTGKGQPDYAHPVTDVPTARSLVVKFPEREIAGQRYNDSATINFTDALTEYIIGTNANAALAGSWPSGVVAKDIAFYATQACSIRFNDRRATPHPIPAGLVPVIRFTVRTERIYVTQEVLAGTLYVWIEG